MESYCLNIKFKRQYLKYFIQFRYLPEDFYLSEIVLLNNKKLPIHWIVIDGSWNGHI